MVYSGLRCTHERRDLILLLLILTFFDEQLVKNERWLPLAMPTLPYVTYHTNHLSFRSPRPLRSVLPASAI
jgi:hypothetical protein